MYYFVASPSRFIRLHPGHDIGLSHVLLVSIGESADSDTSVHLLVVSKGEVVDYPQVVVSKLSASKCLSDEIDDLKLCFATKVLNDVLFPTLQKT